MPSDTFDWTEILSEPERSRVRDELKARKGRFLERFPTQQELDDAAAQGRISFERAKNIVDNRKETERLLVAAADYIAGTLEQPTDPRAWRMLLTYCPRDILETALKNGYG